MTNTPIRLVIVDDHELVRHGIVSFLKSFPDLEVLSEGRNGYDAIRLCSELNPDILMIDIIMPGMDGVTAIGRIHLAQPNIKIIALTSSSDTINVTQAIQAGALSYLLKDVDSEHLVASIRAAYRGERTLAPEATQALINVVTRLAEPQNTLSDREKEVLRYIAIGMTNAEIAKEMFISRSTVKYHVSSILTKLNVATRAEAITVAIKRGLVT
jgi:two-component system, NarL family, response regulator LiaR